MAALLASVQTMLASEPTRQAVVFSQFTGFLDLIGAMLDRAQPPIPYARLDGSMSLARRRQQLDTFGTAAGSRACPLFLVSTKAGGLGLNLTNASRVYMVSA